MQPPQDAFLTGSECVLKNAADSIIEARNVAFKVRCLHFDQFFYFLNRSFDWLRIITPHDKPADHRPTPGLNTQAFAGVEREMKPAWLPIAALTAFFIIVVPNSSHAPAPAKVTTPLQAESRPGVVGRRALVNLESWVADMKSGQRNSFAAGRSAGNLWIEVNQLKRSGQDVRRIEWRVSELEESLQNNRQDASARRHIVNDLELEIQLLRQRGR